MNNINAYIAFTAGLASFLAPCVVSLLPLYISYITGLSWSELKQGSRAYFLKIGLNSLLYCAGFCLVFVLMGLTATKIGLTLVINRVLLTQIGGVLIILFGLSSLGLFRLPLGGQNFTLPESVKRIRYLNTFVLGMTFAVAWTPCVGAILGTILTLAATSMTAGEGAFLLFIYSLGIAVPFVLIALTISSSYQFLLRARPILAGINVVAGVLMIGLGVLMVMGRTDIFSGFLLNVLLMLRLQ